MGEFIARAFSPVVLVVASKDAEGVCSTSDLCLTELLQPFSSFAVNKPQYPNDFHVRFLSLRDITRPTLKEAKETTFNIVSAHEVSYPTEEEKSSGALEAERTPWFTSYCREFLGLVRASEHEYFNHPVACVCVVSTSNKDPVGYLEKAFDPATPPRQFAAQQLDANIYRHYVVLHDHSKDGDASKADTVLAQMKERFGEKNCQKLVINTFEGEKDESDGMKDIWTDTIRSSTAARGGQKTEETSAANVPQAAAATTPEQPNTNGSSTDPLSADPLSSGDAATDGSNGDDVAIDPVAAGRPRLPGRRISAADLKRIQQFVVVLGSDGLVPYLEALAQRLSAYVSLSKKSTLSSARKWLGFSSSQNSNRIALETQDKSLAAMPLRQAMRRMADVFFLLQDYETAINTYHSVKKEFSHEKSWKDYAGAQEMEGVAIFLQDPSRGDNRYFDVAIQAYDRCKALLYLCRANLIAANIALERGRYTEACIAFMRSANEESDLRSALLLEQVATCHLQRRPPRRKLAAFHLVLAGHRFVKAGLNPHALRCYMQARRVYRDMGWSLSEDHVNFTVGRQAFFVGNTAEALEAYSRLLLGEGQQQTSQQKQYVIEFVKAWKTLHRGAGDGTHELPLPLIQDASMALLLTGDEAYSTVGVHSKEWSALEQALLLTARPQRPRVSSMSVFTRTVQVDTNPICVAGEPFYVDVALTNPLHVSIDLRNVQIQGVIRIADGSNVVLDAPKQASLKISQRGDKRIKLVAVPQVAGNVQITGITYSLSGTVFGCRTFQAQGKRLNKTAAAKRGVLYAPDYRLLPIVIPPMPRLEGKVVGLKDGQLVAGEVVEGSLQLVNTSSAPLFRMFVASSRPEMVHFGPSSSVGTAGEKISHSIKQSCIRTSTGSVSDAANNAFAHGPPRPTEQLDVDVVTLEIPEGLQPGTSLSIPFSCMATSRETGKQDVLFMVYYEAEKPHASLPYRVLRVSVNLVVTPSIIVASSVHRLPHKLNERLIRFNVSNTLPDKEQSVRLLALFSNTEHWAIDTVTTTAAKANGFVIGSGETLSFVCRAKEMAAVAMGGVRTSEPEDGATAARAVLDLGGTLTVQQCSNLPADLYLAHGHNAANLRGLIVWETTGTTTAANNAHADAGTVAPIFGQTGVRAKLVHADNEESNTLSGIEFAMEHPSTFENDFTTNPIAIIHATLRIKNVMESAVSVGVELTDPNSTPSSSENGRNSSRFSWIGKTRVTLTEMAAQSEVAVPVALAVTCGGMYNISRGVQVRVHLQVADTVDGQSAVGSPTKATPAPASPTRAVTTVVTLEHPSLVTVTQQ
eukprot:m.769825 g.769825  ORF g.769825 m.769825 type:complete len:1315 (+) comp23236_c0_seq2:380-4324(+)